MDSSYLNSSVSNYFQFIEDAGIYLKKRYSRSEKNYYLNELPECIKKLVSRHLFPYITNKITEKEEKERSTSFLKTTLRYLPKTIDKNKICPKFHSIILKSEGLWNFIFSCYIDHATQGLFTNYHLHGNQYIPGEKKPIMSPKDIAIYTFELSLKEQMRLQRSKNYQYLLGWYRTWTQNHTCSYKFSEFTKPVLILLHALKPALEKDFPYMQLTSEEIIQKTLISLAEFSHNRKIEYKETNLT